MRRASILARARVLALVLPALLLGGALISQYGFGLYPCEMCMWQRWPHLAAIVAAIVAILLRGNPPMSATFTLLAALAILTSGAIGAFHAGVEYGWWEGFTTCSTMGPPPPGMSQLDAIMNAPLTRCDVAPWDLMGISLAGFNAILSILGALAIFALVRRWGRA